MKDSIHLFVLFICISLQWFHDSNSSDLANKDLVKQGVKHVKHASTWNTRKMIQPGVQQKRNDIKKSAIERDCWIGMKKVDETVLLCTILNTMGTRSCVADALDFRWVAGHL